MPPTRIMLLWLPTTWAELWMSSDYSWSVEIVTYKTSSNLNHLTWSFTLILSFQWPRQSMWSSQFHDHWHVAVQLADIRGIVANRPSACMLRLLQNQMCDRIRLVGAAEAAQLRYRLMGLSICSLHLHMSVIRVIFNRPCSPRSRHLAAGVGHKARDQPRRPRRPWHRRPGPPIGSPSPGVPVTGTLAPTGRQFWSCRCSAAWLKPGWGTFECCCWPVERSKCSEHIAWVRRGSLPAGHWAAACNWIFHKFHCGHQYLRHGPCEFQVRLPGP